MKTFALAQSFFATSNCKKMLC